MVLEGSGPPAADGHTGTMTRGLSHRTRKEYARKTARQSWESLAVNRMSLILRPLAFFSWESQAINRMAISLRPLAFGEVDRESCKLKACLVSDDHPDAPTLFAKIMYGVFMLTTKKFATVMCLRQRNYYGWGVDYSHCRYVSHQREVKKIGIL
ncbi:unnamed protein product [Gongylonema pulchrum]|uniref:Uncharacterized protein n=1 Tax=Gongylonema pulchrum TaxID=637853 RepID=A0A183DY33_9BILA|nr:unnamed protein product [Gongylonema pulchrum]